MKSFYITKVQTLVGILDEYSTWLPSIMKLFFVRITCVIFDS